MKLSTAQVRKVAELANLPVSVDEEILYSEQLSEILNYVDLLNQVNTTTVDPTFNVIHQKNVMRADISESSLAQEDALKNAKNTKDGYFVTKGVFNEG